MPEPCEVRRKWQDLDTNICEQNDRILKVEWENILNTATPDKEWWWSGNDYHLACQSAWQKNIEQCSSDLKLEKVQLGQKLLLSHKGLMYEGLIRAYNYKPLWLVK